MWVLKNNNNTLSVLRNFVLKIEFEGGINFLISDIVTYILHFINSLIYGFKLLCISCHRTYCYNRYVTVSKYFLVEKCLQTKVVMLTVM